MKKKTLFTFIAVIILRIINIIIINKDPVFYLSPRNFNGRGLIAMPSWIDFLIPVIIIVFMIDTSNFKKISFKNISQPLIYAILLIMTPVFTGILLYNYIQKTSLNLDFNMVLVLRYLLFIITYIAINIFWDSVTTKRKILRFFILSVFLLFMAYTQDIFASGNSMFKLLGLINSVGVSTVLIAIGMRRIYKSYPLESILAVSFIGIILIFFRFNVLSISFLTIFVPFVSFLIMALTLNKNWKLKTKLFVASIPFVLAFLLSFVLPKLVPPAMAKELVERVPEEKFFEEKAGSITVKYKDENLKEISLKLAKVIEKANLICKEKFGVSPEVKELVIKGIAPGGFHAEFPNRIVGNIISERYLENCADSSFLNDAGLSADFPDPVNAILHEYSHLFGVIPYVKWWPGAEEEGWATYSATRISKLLYEKYNSALWQPAYDYSTQADKIARQNLSGKAVTWSHPNEFGGFNLWYHLGEDYGLKKMYNLRWQNSRHDIEGSLFIISDPNEAKKVVSVFGKEKFEKYGQLPVKKFKDIYSLDDYMYLANTTGIDTSRISNFYKQIKAMTINPSVPVP